MDVDGVRLALVLDVGQSVRRIPSSPIVGGQPIRGDLLQALGKVVKIRSGSILKTPRAIYVDVLKAVEAGDRRALDRLPAAASDYLNAQGGRKNVRKT